MPKLALIFVAFFLTIFLFQESSYGFIEGFDSPPLPNFDITKSSEITRIGNAMLEKKTDIINPEMKNAIDPCRDLFHIIKF